MTDGFSTPDPANVEPDEIEDAEDLTIYDHEPSCSECSHYRTCALVSGYRQMTEEWKAGDLGDESPVDAEELAVICDEYDPE